MKHCKTAIIGAGPAGISCAVQLKRYGITPLLFEKNMPGGLLRNADFVENYPGFESGISGPELADKFSEFAESSGIKPVFAEVKKVSFVQSDSCFVIETNTKNYTSEILVVASGTMPKRFEIPVKNAVAKEIFYEITDIDKNIKNIMPDKKFAVVGAGDAAFDYALNLVNNYGVSEVVVLNRKGKTKCLPLLEERALKSDKIKHIKNISVKSIEEKEGNFILSCVTDSGKQIITTDYLMCATGRKADTGFLDETVIKNSSELQNRGLLYFAGDVANGSLRQALIAAGDGLKTAMRIALN